MLSQRIVATYSVLLFFLLDSHAIITWSRSTPRNEVPEALHLGLREFCRNRISTSTTYVPLGQYLND